MIYTIKTNTRGVKTVEFNYDNIYGLLRKEGFGYSDLTKKGVYYRKSNSQIEITNLRGIRRFLVDWIRNELKNDPNQHDVLNECLKINPINNQRPNKILLENKSNDELLKNLI